MFDWYSITSNAESLEQGDFLDAFPIIVPTPSLADLSQQAAEYEVVEIMPVDKFDVVVMTQSCDLAKLKGEDEVILCPRFDYTILTKTEQKYRGQDGWTKLRTGRIIGAYLVNKCGIKGHELDYQIVDLRRVFSAPLSLVTRVAQIQGDRVRLLPPYREHLAQAFARQFMRVGLPIDLPRKYPYQQ